MTLSDKMKADASAISHPNMMGETITVTPTGGSANPNVRATVNRLGRVRADDFSGAKLIAEVFIPNHATYGVSSMPTGTAVQMAMEQGGSVLTCRVETVISQDPGGWLVEVHY